MKTILAIVVASVLASCSPADLGNFLAGTSLNILGKPSSYASLIKASSDSALENAEQIALNENNEFVVDAGGEEIRIEVSLSPGAAVYAQDDALLRNLSLVLELDGGAEALAAELSGEVSGDALDVLHNTATLYGDIIDYAAASYGASLPAEAVTIINDIRQGFAELSGNDGLTEADAVLVQAFTSLVYSSLDVLASAADLPEGSDISSVPGLQSLIGEAGLLVSYSEAVMGTAASSLPGTLAGLYDDLLTMIGGGAA